MCIFTEFFYSNYIILKNTNNNDNQTHGRREREGGADVGKSHWIVGQLKTPQFCIGVEDLRRTRSSTS